VWILKLVTNEINYFRKNNKIFL